MVNATAIPLIRIAQCGHEYAAPAKTGRARMACDDCIPVEISPATSCVHCSAVIPARLRGTPGPAAKYCSRSCATQMSYAASKVDGRYQVQMERARAKRALTAGPHGVTCVECGAAFEARKRTTTLCSSKCTNKKLDRENPIRCSEADCDRGVRGKGLCSMHWRRKARAEGREANRAWDDSRKANYHKRRAQKLGTQVEDLRPIDIYERDIWLCGLCVTPVDPDCAWPDPMSPSLDHILPLSKGGTHTYENVQLAHLTCNVSKGNRIAA